MTPTIVMCLTCAGVAIAFVAVAMTVRDLLSRRFNVVDQRIHLDADEGQISRLLRERQVHNGRVDQLFYQLLDESGTALDAPSALTLVIGCGVVCSASPFALADSILGSAAGLAIGCALPIIWLAVKRWMRIRAFRTLLPEALQIVADHVRAGHNLEQASEMVFVELKGPLADEFGQCASQMKLGNSPLAIMEGMTGRIPLPEFRIFATAVMVHESSGGNLSLLTERLAHAARQRQEFVGHLNAVTAGSRLSALGLIVGSIIAMASLAWLEPDYVAAFVNNDLGPTLLAIAIGLQCLGAVWVWRILRVTY